MPHIREGECGCHKFSTSENHLQLRKAAPEVTAVVARVLTGREQFASILAPRSSLVVIARDDAEQKMKKNEDDGVVAAAGKNVK